MSLAPQLAPRPRPQRGLSPRLRIVVADDNADLADTLALLLSIDGHEVHCADDGEQALALVRRLRPQVAVLDLGMPRLSGYAVAHAIRAEDWGARMRLIAITGDAAPDSALRAAAAGFDCHLRKPVGALDLLECLAELADAGGGGGRFG